MTTRRYEDAILRIIHESLASAGKKARDRFDNPLLAEIQRRMRHDRERLRSLLRGRSILRREDRHEVLRSASRTVAGMPGRIRSAPAQFHRTKEQITRRVRKRITGAEAIRIRDHFRSKLEEPMVIRFRDKISFFLGVAGCGLIEFFVLAHPRLYPYCYACFAVPLMTTRLYIYKALNWHLFLFDFCYFVNVLCIIQVVLPTSRHLLLINFAHTMGPLAIAIPTWRNSLVFHSLDKVTSVFIHGAPGLLLFCVRWYPSPRVAPLVTDPVTFKEFFLLGMGGYVCWQLTYIFITEVLCARQLATNFDMMTSTRWLTTAPYSGITAIAYKACKFCAIMQSGELFDAETWKTKFVFMGVQFWYTAATLLLVPLLWSSFHFHLTYLLVTYSICIWNGGSYYIEVFSKAYRTQFEGDAVTRRLKAIEAFAVPKRPKEVSDGGTVIPAVRELPKKYA